MKTDVFSFFYQSNLSKFPKNYVSQYSVTLSSEVNFLNGVDRAGTLPLGHTKWEIITKNDIFTY